MQLHAAVYSHAGKVRQNNEDNYLLFEKYRQDVTANTVKECEAGPARECVFAVCDGMGGESAGEVASLFAVKGLKPCTLENVRKEANEQILQTNDIICDEIKKRNGTRIGSTVAALYIDKNTAVCCNLGDSRVYLLRGGHLEQVSRDHSEAQRMMDMGVMSTETARKSNIKHRLTQHLGIFSDEFVIEPFISENIELQDNDIFLLCSDGLTDMLSDSEIERLLGENTTPEAVSEKLISAALKNGGIDNVTSLVIRVSKAMKEHTLSNKAKVKKSGNKRSLVIVCITLCLAVMAGIGFGLYAFFTGSESSQNEDQSISETIETDLELSQESDS